MLEIIKTAIISFLMVALTICGDYFVKKASLFKDFDGWKYLLIGSFFYGFSAVGWFYVYRMTKVFTVGAIHSFGAILMTIVLSVLIFKEKLTLWEAVGLLLGTVALVIFIRSGNIG